MGFGASHVRHVAPTDRQMWCAPTLDIALRVAEPAEAARIDALFTADLLSLGARGAIGSQEPLVLVSH